MKTLTIDSVTAVDPGKGAWTRFIDHVTFWAQKNGIDAVLVPTVVGERFRSWFARRDSEWQRLNEPGEPEWFEHYVRYLNS